MELTEKITLDMLTQDSVSVLRQQFLNISGTEMQVGGNIRNAYVTAQAAEKTSKRHCPMSTTTRTCSLGRYTNRDGGIVMAVEIVVSLITLAGLRWVRLLEL